MIFITPIKAEAENVYEHERMISVDATPPKLVDGVWMVKITKQNRYAELAKGEIVGDET